MKALIFKLILAFLATRFGALVSKLLGSWPVLLLLASMQIYFCIHGVIEGSWLAVSVGMFGLVFGLWNIRDRRKHDLHLRSLLPLRVRVWLSHPFYKGNTVA